MPYATTSPDLTPRPLLPKTSQTPEIDSLWSRTLSSEMALTAASIPRSEYVEDGCASVIFKFEQKKLSGSRGGIPNTVQLTAARNESIRTRFRTPTRFPLWRAGLLARMGIKHPPDLDDHEAALQPFSQQQILCLRGTPPGR